MKKILVLGATGAMGTYLVPELSRMRYKVDAITLDNIPEATQNVSFYNYNAKDDTVLSEVLKNTRYDAIVDFMLYSEAEFLKRYEMLLNSTEHYIFFSSYRVYADTEHPIKETSPRLLDISEDKEFLKRADIEYALYKARKENILKASKFSNWTILRPTMVYSHYRYQLVGLEANSFLSRVQLGKTVVLPENAMDLHAAMTWSGDIAKMISRLILNPKAFGQTFTVGSAEIVTWREVAEIYREVLGLKYITVSSLEYKKIFAKIPDEWYKHIYDRFYDRLIDNSKVLNATGLCLSDFTPIKEGLKKELENIPQSHKWQESFISKEMDKFLQGEL